MTSRYGLPHANHVSGAWDERKYCSSQKCVKINEQKKNRVFIYQTPFAIAPWQYCGQNPRLTLNITCLQNIVTALLSFFSPAPMRLYNTEQSIFTVADMLLMLISFFLKAKCSWENGKCCWLLFKSLFSSPVSCTCLQTLYLSMNESPNIQSNV